MTEEKDLELDKIRTDGGTQQRAGLNDESVADHCDGYEHGEDRPPLDVFHDGSHYWLVDGFHRYHGALRAKLETHPCRVHKGTLRDAILFSVGCNSKHGLKRTNEDKRKAIETLLKDSEWTKASSAWIAEKCNVSNHLVARHRESFEGQSQVGKFQPGKTERGAPSDERRIGKNGVSQPAVKNRTKPDKSASCPPVQSKPPTEKPPKPGAIINRYMDVTELKDALGKGMRLVDKVVAEYGESAYANAIHDLIRQAFDNINDWKREHDNQLG